MIDTEKEIAIMKVLLKRPSSKNDTDIDSYFGATTFTQMTLGTMTFGIMKLIITKLIHDNQFNCDSADSCNAMCVVVMLIVYVLCFM